MHDPSPADNQESRVVQCGEGNGMAGKAGRASDRELCPRAFLKIPVTPSYWHVFRNKKHFYNVELTEEKKKKTVFSFFKNIFFPSESTVVSQEILDKLWELSA